MQQSNVSLARSAPPQTETELIELARRGDEQASRAIIQTYNLRLFRIARGILRDEAEAEDALQEAYLKAFTNLQSFRGAAKLSTWLTRIVINEAVGRLRRRRPTSSIEAADTAQLAEGAHIIAFPTCDADANPESATARTQVRQLLERAVDELPEPFRLVFVMRDIEGMSMEETAAALGLKPETVKTRLFRARRLMRKTLQEQLISTLANVFPFGGLRCSRMADAVIARLASQSTGHDR